MGLEIKSVGVVGLGYVGLPTSIAFYNANFRVRGVDVSTAVIDMLKEGASPLVDQTEVLSIPEESERWSVGLNCDILEDCEVILITVPTPVTSNKEPDLSFVEAASRSVLRSIPRGRNRVVVLESTVYPGVTRNLLGGMCEEIGLVIGSDVTLAYCPERIDPGTDMGVGNIARVVGCDDPMIGESLAEMYGKTTSAESIYVGKMEVAEASKMVENLQRDIDIAMVNELAQVLPKHGVDVEEVLQAASTKWNFKRFTPGIGVGGHCIPVDPYYYIQLARDAGMEPLLALSARNINESMPRVSAFEISEIIRRKKSETGGSVLLLGYAYKANLGDTRETPVEDLADELIGLGIKPIIWDPLVQSDEVPDRFERIDSLNASPSVDCVVISTAHRQVLEIDWGGLKDIVGCSSIYDGRRAMNKNVMSKLGWNYSGVGASST
jgi:nucleotide sugar dehydrogenase